VKVAEFIKEVRVETNKVVWPTRKDTFSACALVLFMATLAGLFFLLVDSIVYKVIQFILGI